MNLTTWLTCCLLLLGPVSASMQVAASPNEIVQFMQSHDEGLAALFFYDSSDDKESGLLDTLTEAIVGNDEGDELIATMLSVSEEVDLMGVDIVKPTFKDVIENYEIKEAPFLIVFDEGVAAIKEKPDEETIEKIQAFKRIQAVNNVPETVEAVEHQVEQGATAEPVKIEPKPQPKVDPEPNNGVAGNDDSEPGEGHIDPVAEDPEQNPDQPDNTPVEEPVRPI